MEQTMNTMQRNVSLSDWLHKGNAVLNRALGSRLTGKLVLPPSAYKHMLFLNMIMDPSVFDSGYGMLCSKLSLNGKHWLNPQA